MAARLPVLFEDIAIAATRIRGGVVRSPVTHSYWLSQLCGCDVFLKHEQFQFTGSFKERGARNALMSLSEEKKAKGVVAASAVIATGALYVLLGLCCCRGIRRGAQLRYRRRLAHAELQRAYLAERAHRTGTPVAEA